MPNSHTASKESKAYIYATAAVLLWSTVATAFKLSLRYIDVIQLLFIASLTSTICLLSLLLFQKKQMLIWRCSRGMYAKALLLGALNPVCYYLVLFKAYDLLPAQIAQALNYTWAITLILLSVPLLKQRIMKFDFIAVLLCYCGVVVICFGYGRFPMGEISLFGIALALGSTVIWALYWIYKMKDNTDPVLTLFLSFLFSLPFTLFICFKYSSIATISLYGLVGGIYVGLFEMGITYIFWLLALQHAANTAKVSTLIYCSPFLSLIIIHYLLGEAVLPTTFIGLIFIITGLLIQKYYGSPTPSEAGS